MPEVSRPLDNDAFHKMAHDVHRLFDKGVGTMHGKVRLVRDVLNHLATENFKGGYQEGYAKGAQDVHAKIGNHGPLPVQGEGKPVPVPEAGQDLSPGVAFDIRDLNGASVVRVMLSGQVLLRGQTVTDGNQLVHVLSQLGQQMASAAQAASGVG